MSDFGSAPRVQAAREHRWRHIEHLLFECQCIPGLDSSVALALLWDDLFRVCSGSDHADAVLLAAFPTSRIPVVAATACVVPFLLDPAAALAHMSPWHMKLRCLDLVAAFLLGVSSAVCVRQPLAASVLARFCLPAWSSVRAWFPRLRTVFDFAPAHLPAPDPVLLMSAPVRRGTMADARLGLECCPIWFFFFWFFIFCHFFCFLCFGRFVFFVFWVFVLVFCFFVFKYILFFLFLFLFFYIHTSAPKASSNPPLATPPLATLLLAAVCRDLLQCVLADLLNRLSYAGGPFCTVTTASDTHSKVTSRTSGGLACVHADVYRLANLRFLQAVSKPYVHQAYSSELRWRSHRATGSSIPLQGACGAWLVALLLACSPHNRRAFLTQLNTLTSQLHSGPICLARSLHNLELTT